mgnify:CR=1 FL=1
MKQRLLKRLNWLMLGGALFGGVGFTNSEQVGGGCVGLVSNGVLSSVAFDRVLNCSGFFGGLVTTDFIIDCGPGFGVGTEDEQTPQQ